MAALSPLLRLTPSCEALAGFPNLRVLKLKSSALLRPFLRVGRPIAQLACLELSVTSSASILEDAELTEGLCRGMEAPEPEIVLGMWATAFVCLLAGLCMRRQEIMGKIIFEQRRQ